MNERRRHKNVNNQKNKKIHRQIKGEARIAKEEHFVNECKELDIYMRVGDSFNLHKKIKEAARVVSKSAESPLTGIDGNLITNLENKFESGNNIWKKNFSTIHGQKNTETRLMVVDHP